MMMENETRCPNCGTTKYANVNLKMMVNVCGHALCESCVELLFVKGASKCPTCGVLLKRMQFRIQLYDDEYVEKDLEIRRRLHKDIALKEEDFDNLREYNDYLEMFETFVYNLANDIDTAETSRRIEQFKSENANKIKERKRMKVFKDMEEIERFLEMERDIQSNRELSIRNDHSLIAQKAANAARKENLLDDLLSSDLPAEFILQRHQRQKENELAAMNEMEAQRQQQRAAALAAKRQQLTFSSGIRLGAGDNNVYGDQTVEQNVESVAFEYKPPLLLNAGPPCPTPRTIVKNLYLNHIRPSNQADLAGGFSSLFPCQRALQEAIIDLTFVS